MALTRPYPIDKAFPNASDVRKGQAVVFPREGVLPDPATTGSGVAVAGSGWVVQARQFTAVLRLGNGPYFISYGAALIANDAVEDAWTLPGAPSSGTITSLLWVKATDPTQGGALTQVPGEVGADGQPRPRAVPIFGVTTGTTTMGPSLPAGALRIASVAISSTSTSAVTSVITQNPLFGSVNGGTLYVRTAAALTTALAGGGIPGEVAYALDTQRAYEIRQDGLDRRWAPKGGGTAHFGRSALQGIPTGVPTTIGILSLASDSDRTDFVTVTGGQLRLVEGDYVMSATPTLETRSVNGARSFCEIQFSDGNVLARGNSWVEERFSVSANFHVGPGGATVRVQIFQTGVSPSQGVSLDGFITKIA